jgi:hypothetical protein
VARGAASSRSSSAAEFSSEAARFTIQDVQGDIEIRPRAACHYCGNRVAPPLGPSYVYGIGALGFQQCSACGARWRCMWPTGAERRRFPARTVALVAAGALTLAVGVAAYAGTRSNGPELTSSTRGALPPALHGPFTSAAGSRYLAIVTPENDAKDELRQFLESVPPLTPKSELDRRVAAFAAVVRRTGAALDDEQWPKAAAAVHELIAADLAYTADLVRGVTLLRDPRFGKRFDTDAAALHTAANRVRAALGLHALGDAPDPRFPPV